MILVDVKLLCQSYHCIKQIESFDDKNLLGLGAIGPTELLSCFSL